MKVKESELIRGNPLLNPTGSFAVKRRFGDHSSINPHVILKLLSLIMFAPDNECGIFSAIGRVAKQSGT